MKKIQRMIYSLGKSTLSLSLAILFILTAIFSSMGLAGYKFPLTANAATTGDSPTIEVDGEQLIIRDDALHFIFRHWHTNWDSEATLQSEGDARRRDQYDADTGRYFVMVEGYIIPHNEKEMEGRQPENQFTIVLVNQATGELVQASTLYDDHEDYYTAEWVQEHGGKIELTEPTTPYLGKMNKTTGSIELKVKKLADVYTDINGEEVRNDTEKFCGVSLSAGRAAAKLEPGENGGETETIVIEYNKSSLTHIVKGHIFYSSWTKVVTGTTDERLINGEDPEVDTAEVYTWNAEGTTSGYKHEEGEVVAYIQNTDGSYSLVSSETSDSNVVKKGEEDILAKLGLTVGPQSVGEVQLTTFYSSYEGLHTNKTLVQGADGRYFLFDLEAWYIEGYAAQLGYVIDASGSMAGTSDIPSILNIYVAIANRLGVLFDDSTGEYSYTHYDKDVDPEKYHTHYLKTCSMPHFEFRDAAGETHSIQASRIETIDGYTVDRTGTDDIALGAANETDPQPAGSYKFNRADERLDENGKLIEVYYVKFDGEDGPEVKLETYEKDNKTYIKYNNDEYELISTYYSPTDEEHRIDMQKFLVTGDMYTPSTTKHPGYCWAGLVKEFGKAELCKTITTTIGGDYVFTEEMWDAVTALKGKANQIGSTVTNYYYPQRDRLIGYYAITNASGSVDYDGYRRWYLNSIDTDLNGDGIRKYIEPKNNYPEYTDEKYYAKAVLQGKKTEGAELDFDFSESNSQFILHYSNFVNFDGKFPNSSSWNNVPANFSAGTASGSGFNLAGGGNGYGATGFKLSAASTPNGSFTISFILERQTGWGNNNAEILYIGSNTGKIDDADFRLVREDNKLMLYHGGKGEELIASYTSTSRQRFTFTYDHEKNEVRFYLDGTYQKTVENVELNNVDCIVFDPFEDWSSDNSVKFMVDEIFVYDTVLSESEVKTFVEATGKYTGTNIDSGTTESTGIDWKDVFVGEYEVDGVKYDLLQLFMNPNNTAHASLGVAAYNYYVYDGASEFYPLAYWDGVKAEKIPSTGSTYYAYVSSSSDTALGELRNYTSNSKAGWYYLSHRSDNGVLLNEKIGTSKALTALKDVDVYDEVDLNSDYKVGPDALNSGKKAYKPTEGETSRFYIDANGNLRCFFSTGTSNALCSYVYELDDSQYVKTEALQRILAYFSAELSEKTPSSQISGIQFSNADRKSEDLVLLDWSSDPDEIAAMLSQKFGNGNATGTNVREDTGVTEHNFALTGGTYTYTGLQSFLENVVLSDNVTVEYDYSVHNGAQTKIESITLTDKDGNTLDPTKLAQKYRRDDENAPKFVIVFTDGADNNYFASGVEPGTYNPAKPVAQMLEDLGYTVIGMYIPAALDPRNENGDLSTEGDTEYSRAIQFLSSIASPDDATGKPHVYASTDLTAVANVFDQKIMESINGIMNGYTVQEYIDPRFDLQTDDGTVWHLNGNGSVTIESVQILGSDGKFATVTIELEGGGEFTYPADGKSHTFNVNLTKESGALFHLIGKDTDGAARDAYLRYDPDEDMYFLIWENQTIRSSPIGSTTMMPVWSVEYWLVAKDDFLGGDAVLTSGNKAGMNYVYHPADVDENAYAKYAFDSWLALSQSLRAKYDSDWSNIWNARDGDEKATYDAYMNQWKSLTAKEQQAMVDQWTTKYPIDKGNVSTTTFTEGKRSDANGARIMYMIAQMNLKRTNQYDANSGTSDMKKLPNKDETPDKVQSADAGLVEAVDEFPSKGLPRIAVNVSPKSVYETDLVSTVYLGEVMSPVLVLNNMVENNPTNWYLNYLARYADYLYGDSSTMPLLDLLEQWDSNYDGSARNSFSVPYMYLPNYQYNVYGSVIKTKLNNAGTEPHWEDVLGLLTFHWELVEGTGSVGTEVVNETTMKAWEKLEFKLTVEFTVFHEGDTHEGIVTELEELAKTDPETYLDIFDGGNIHLIAKNGTTLETLQYNRTTSLNDLVTDESGHYRPTVRLASTTGGESDEAETNPSGSAGDVPGDGPGIFDDEFLGKVDKNKVTVAALAELMEIDEEEAEKIVNPQDKFYNNGRTQQVVFDYQPSVVGAELALELKIEATEEQWEALSALPTITLEVTREFKDDNAIAQGLKTERNLDDYGATFTVTFKLMKSDEEPVNGVYTLYAKADGYITGTFGGNPVNDLTALPIGEYTYSSSSARPTTFDSLTHAGFETVAEKFQSSYFSDKVASLFENPDGVEIAQIKSGVNYGTTDDVRDYDSRLGMIILKATLPDEPETVKLTIVEIGGKSNESFLYEVRDVESGVSIIVSVKGGSSTTIIMPRGTYTVTEISEWSWRYYSGAVIEASVNGNVEWKVGNDGELQGSDDGYWSITQETDADVATIAFSGSASHAVVTYQHTANNKGWLGGENYKDYSFVGNAS